MRTLRRNKWRPLARNGGVLSSEYLPEKADETKKEFNELLKDEKQLNDFIEITKEHFNNTMIENYYVLILYYSNLISHNHNNKSK